MMEHRRAIGAGRAGILALGLLLLSVQPLRAERYQEIEVKDGGSIKGRVTFDGTPPELFLTVNADLHTCQNTDGKVESPRLRVSADGGVADTVVYLRDISKGKPLSALNVPATIDQEGCLYHPFVQVMPQKGVLTLVNSDPLNHNVHARQEKQRDPFNYAMPNSGWPEKQKIEKRMIRPGLVTINCDVHMWMSAYLFVVQHPYYAVTDEEGRYELTDIPAGDYELVAWHPGWEAEMKRNPQGQPSGYEYEEPVERTKKVTVEPAKELEADFTLGSAAK